MTDITFAAALVALFIALILCYWSVRIMWLIRQRHKYLDAVEDANQLGEPDRAVKLIKEFQTLPELDAPWWRSVWWQFWYWQDLEPFKREWSP